MRVSTKEIMLLGNPQHEDFGLFAKFITGMGEYVHIQDTMYCCDICSNVGVIILDENNPHTGKKVCMYCRGYKKGKEENTVEKIVEVEKIIEVDKEPKSIEKFYRDHEHIYGNGKNHPCKVCGVFEGVAKIVTENEIKA